METQRKKQTQIQKNVFNKGQKISKKNMLSWILPKNERWGNFISWKLPQRSFFGRIQDAIICFWDLLTFSMREITWLNSQQPTPRGHVEHLSRPKKLLTEGKVKWTLNCQSCALYSRYFFCMSKTLDLDFTPLTNRK